MVLKANSVSYYWIAIKVPNHNKPVEIFGNVVISCKLTKNNEIVIPISASLIIPEIKCEKMLKMSRFERPVLKIFFKMFWR